MKIGNTLRGLGLGLTALVIFMGTSATTVSEEAPIVCESAYAVSVSGSEVPELTKI